MVGKAAALRRMIMALLMALTVRGLFTAQAQDTLQNCTQGAGMTLPQAAPPIDAYPDLLTLYLNAGGSITSLEQQMMTWGAIVDDPNLFGNGSAGLVRDDVDFDGDGLRDVLVVALNRQPEMPSVAEYPGRLFMFICRGAAYGLAYQVSNDDYSSFPVVRLLDDLNADGRTDLLYEFITCGAHTCYDDYHGLRWDAEAATFVDLLAEQRAEPYASVEAQDRDGVQEIVVHGGAIGSVGAGAQRTYDYIYAWDGEQYALSDKVLTSDEFVIHIVNDADAALDSGGYDEALTLYQRALTDPNLLNFGDTRSLDLDRYAQYKIIVTLAAMGDYDAAQNNYRDLLANFSETQPGGEFVMDARRFWTVFSTNRDIVAACMAVVDSLAVNYAENSPLNQFGYANRYYQPHDICPFAPAG